MVLHDPVEIHQFAVDVVQYLDVGGLLGEEDGGRAGEELDVAGVPTEARQDSVGQATLAAYPRDEG